LDPSYYKFKEPELAYIKEYLEEINNGKMDGFSMNPYIMVKKEKIKDPIISV